MPDWLFSRTTIIGLAVIGGLLSMIATWCQSQGKISEKSVIFLNRAAYVFMAISMVLFIGVGLVGTRQ